MGGSQDGSQRKDEEGLWVKMGSKSKGRSERREGTVRKKKGEGAGL